MPTSVAVVCMNTSEKVVSQSTLRIPSTATIADLKFAISQNAKMTVQILIAGAVPSEATPIADLSAVYASSDDGLLHVSYSIERSFGAGFYVTPNGNCAGEC